MTKTTTKETFPMKALQASVIIIAAAAVAFFGLPDAMARGGGGHGGGYHGGGGWSGGGRGGGGGEWAGRGGEERGGEYRGGDRPGRGGEYHGDHDHGDHDNHRHNNNNNNNNNSGNTTNNYSYNGPGGWGWGYGAADDALAGMMVGTAIGAVAVSNSQPTTVVVEQPPVVINQQVQAAAVPIGTQVAMLPGGSQGHNINGNLLYQAGPNWYKPYFGSNGVYYEVVQAPAQPPQAGGQ